MDKLLQKIKSTELPGPCQAINLIVIGHTGSGKSSFVNTLLTVLTRNSSQISTTAASYGVNYSSTTDSLHEIKLLRNWNEKKLRNYDCRGVETPNEYYEKDLIKTISGCIKKDYKFQTENSIRDDSIFLRKTPVISDKMHCVLFVASADQDFQKDKTVIAKVQTHLREETSADQDFQKDKTVIAKVQTHLREENMADEPKKLTYETYLGLDKLLKCQELESENAGNRVAEEHLFNIVHQGFEIWFKQILEDFKGVIDILNEPRIPEQTHLSGITTKLGRCILILKVVIQHFEIIETMPPAVFLNFRKYLKSGSGFQSLQFRQIENTLGLRPETREQDQPGKGYKNALNKEQFKVAKASEDGDTLFSIAEAASLKKVFIHDAESSDADAHGREMTVEKQEIYKDCNRSCHGTILIKGILCLALFCLPCAGGTGHGNDQIERQDHSEIVKSTLGYVSNCPISREHIQIINCTDVCGRNCTYHCMRDSSKTKLVEFCAIPKILFDYCPEYDPVDHTIQKDQATPCNSKFSQIYYYSSDIFFCDPDNCLQVHGSNVRSGATTLTTLMTGTTEINGGDNPQAWFSLILLLAFAATI